MESTVIPTARIFALDFAADLQRLATDFTGRAWVFDDIERWLQDACGAALFLLTGEPGVGKSAIAAHVVQTRADIAAYHFCIAGRNETIVPSTVLRSLAAQLGERLPGYGAALANSIRPTHLTVTVNINVQTMTGGQVTGVVIQNLTALEPQTELELLLRAPLGTLPAPARPLMIVIDSLDEAATLRSDPTLVSLLASLGGLPEWLRILCTSRPDQRVLSYFDQLRPYSLAAESRMNLNDIRQYVTYRVQQTSIKEKLLAAGQPEAAFIVHLAGERDRQEPGIAAGNFLYTKMLLNDIEAGRQSLANLDELPHSLDEIYHNFLRRFSIQDWEQRYQLLFGVLSVALEPLTETQLVGFTSQTRTALRQNLGIVRQFLDVGQTGDDNETYRIFHQSLRDYLLDDKRSKSFFCAAEDFHRRIADTYLARYAAAWSACDDYGLRHLPQHLVQMEEAQRLPGLLLDFGWMQAKLDRIDIRVLLADYDLAEADDDVHLVHDALRLAAHVLAVDKTQLPSQLIGRLSAFDSVRLQSLVDNAKAWRGAAWLCPLTPSLDAPGSPLRWTLKGRAGGHAGTTRSVAITPDGRWAISAGNSNNDQTVRVWDLYTGECRHTLERQAAPGGYTPVALSAAGDLAVTGYGDELRAWDLATVTLRDRLRIEGSTFVAVTLSDDGHQALTLLEDGSVRIWDLDKRAAVALPGRHARILAIAMTRDGRQAVSLSDSLMKAWDLQEMREIAALPAPDESTFDAHVLALSPDGYAALFGSPLQRWTIGQDVAVAVPTAGITGTILAVTPDSRRIVTATGDRTLAVWDLLDQTHLFELRHEGLVVQTCLAITPDGRCAITADFEHDLRVWDLTATGRTEPASLVDRLQFVDFTGQGDAAVFRAPDGALQAWDIARAAFITDAAAAGASIQDVQSNVARRAKTHASVMAELNRLLALSNDQPAVFARSGKTSNVSSNVGDQIAVAASVDGKRAVSVMRPRGKYGDFEEPEQAGPTDRGREVSLWDLGAAPTHRVMLGHTTPVTAVDMTPDGRLAVTGCWGRLVRVWDLDAGAEQWVLRGHGGIVSSVSITPDGRRCASASEDSTVRVWDLTNGRLIANFAGEGWMESCRISPNGLIVVAQESSGRVHILRVYEAGRG